MPLPTPPALPFAQAEERDAELRIEAAIPLREGARDFRPRSRGWRTLR